MHTEDELKENLDLTAMTGSRAGSAGHLQCLSTPHRPPDDRLGSETAFHQAVWGGAGRAHPRGSSKHINLELVSVIRLPFPHLLVPELSPDPFANACSFFQQLLPPPCLSP